MRILLILHQLNLEASRHIFSSFFQFLQLSVVILLQKIVPMLFFLFLFYGKHLYWMLKKIYNIIWIRLILLGKKNTHPSNCITLGLSQIIVWILTQLCFSVFPFIIGPVLHVLYRVLAIRMSTLITCNKWIFSLKYHINCRIFFLPLTD